MDRKPPGVRKAIRGIMAKEDLKYTQALRIWDNLPRETQDALIEQTRLGESK